MDASDRRLYCCSSTHDQFALQGASGVGYGNFMEIGPLDEELKPRATTWLAKADLLFVVGNQGNLSSIINAMQPPPVQQCLV